jgi:hypothetical protein
MGEKRARSRRLRTQNSGKKYRLFAPEIVRDPTRRRFAFPVRTVLKVVGADEYVELRADEVSTRFDSPPAHSLRRRSPSCCDRYFLLALLSRFWTQGAGWGFSPTLLRSVFRKVFFGHEHVTSRAVDR